MNKTQGFVEKFSAILQKQGTITAESAQKYSELFKERSKPSFVNFLLQEGLVERENLLKALSEYYQKPAFDVVGHFFDEHYVQMFPVEVMVRNLFVPLERDENILVVVASNPNNEELLNIIGNYVSYDIRFNVGIAQDIKDVAREFSDKAVTQYPTTFGFDIDKEEREKDEARRIILGEEEQD